MCEGPVVAVGCGCEEGGGFDVPATGTLRFLLLDNEILVVIAGTHQECQSYQAMFL
jgi:hypothetical protein